jgi:hypothetical protein
MASDTNSTTQFSTGILISWDEAQTPLDNTVSYNVYRSNYSNFSSTNLIGVATTNSFFDKSTQELVETFKKIGMKQMPFQVEESEKDLPEFESVYSFRNKADNGAEYLFEILDKKNEILQINLQINVSKSLLLSNLNKHLKILKDKCDQKFGFSSPMENGEMTTIQYDNELLMIGIQVIKSKNHIIHFKVANKFLW